MSTTTAPSTDTSRRQAFVPLTFPRLVPAGPRVALRGPGTRFKAGTLVVEPQRDGRVVQLTGRSR